MLGDRRGRGGPGEVRTLLDLVDDHQALQMAEGELGLVQAGEVVRVLQVVAAGRPSRRSMTCRASVVLPTCRAPRSATTGWWVSRCSTRSRWRGRGITPGVYVKNERASLVFHVSTLAPLAATG